MFPNIIVMLFFFFTFVLSRWMNSIISCQVSYLSFSYIFLLWPIKPKWLFLEISNWKYRTFYWLITLNKVNHLNWMKPPSFHCWCQHRRLQWVQCIIQIEACCRCHWSCLISIVRFLTCFVLLQGSHVSVFFCLALCKTIID